jgi:hypothetical protein
MLSRQYFWQLGETEQFRSLEKRYLIEKSFIIDVVTNEISGCNV